MPPAPRKLVVHVVSHTHWDRAWYWTFEESRLRLLDLLDDLLALLERDPGFRHFVLDGQLAMVLDYLELRPEASRRIQRLARDGRLCLGPLFVLPDLFIPRGESLVRNLRLGAAAARGLGRVMPLGYLPDPFGLPAQLPQILRGFGLDGVFLSRGVGDEGERLGADFRWRAPDGSEVLATHQLAGGYCNLARLGDGLGGEEGSAAACRRIREVVEALAPDCPSGVLLLSNGCDHLPAQPELPALLEAARPRLDRDGIVLRHSTPVAYQRAVRRAIADRRFRPALHQGELRGSRYANLLSGVLSSRVDLKLSLDACERELLHWAEPFSAIASLCETSDRDQRAALDHAWRLLLLCQPHDDICGCSVDAVHQDDQNRLARSTQVARQLASRSLSSIASRVAAPGYGERVVAFNPHPFPLPTRLELAGWRGGIAAPDGPLVSQPTDRGVLVEVELPPLGWLALASSQHRDRPTVAGEVRARRRGASVLLENDRLRVRVAGTGALELETLAPSRARHRLELCDEGDAGDSYDFSPLPRSRPILGFARPPRIRILESGPLRGVLEVSGALVLPVGLSRDRRARSARLRRVPVELRVSLEASSSLCALELAIDNTVDDHRLRLRLQSELRAEALLAGAPFQIARRPLLARAPHKPGWVQQPAPTVPIESFAAFEEGARGVALLAPGLHELEGRLLSRRRGTEIYLTLLRSVRWLSRADLATRRGHAGPGLPVEGARQLGLHSFRIGIRTYLGSWAAAGIPREARAHASPPRVVERPSASEGVLPAHGSLLAIDAPAIELSALEAGPQAGTLIARLVNLESRPRRVRLDGPFRRARRLRLDGTPIPGRIELAAIPLRPAEICTLLLEIDPTRLP